MTDPTAADQWRLANHLGAPGSNGPAPRDTAQLFLTPELAFREEYEFGRMNAEFSLFTPDAGLVGRVTQIDEGLLTKLFAPNRYVVEVKDTAGHTLLIVSRESSMRVRAEVYRPDGVEIGRFEQQGFGLLGVKEILITSGGFPVGVMRRAGLFSRDFHILDQADNVVASVVDVWDGFAKELFTNADTHVLVTPQPVGDPLGPLLLACPLIVAFLKKQESN